MRRLTWGHNVLALGNSVAKHIVESTCAISKCTLVDVYSNSLTKASGSEVAAECAARTLRPHAAWVTQLEAVGLPIAIAI